MRALVVDPGKLTGFGFMQWDANLQCREEVTFTGGELPMNDFLDNAIHWVMGEPGGPVPVDIVICESFDIRADTAQKIAGGPLFSSEQIGCLRFWSRWRGIPFVLQSPSDMKSFDAGKVKTKALGWWSDRNPAEKGHRRDAASHALLYAVRKNLIDPRRFLT
jgi:hypothetical protein